jgi:hypothetical protein
MIFTTSFLPWPPPKAMMPGAYSHSYRILGRFGEKSGL